MRGRGSEGSEGGVMKGEGGVMKGEGGGGEWY